MRKKIELVILILLVAGLILLNKNLEERITSDRVTAEKSTVVIDAGHGGADPGKVGVGEILEKEINLQIAEKVKERLEKEKVNVVMTREEDTMLDSSEDGGSKAADMKARVKLINEADAQIAISIHQNSYSDSGVHGAQVFYFANSEAGEKAAQIMQKALLSADAENTREAKANNTYYLLRRTEIPTIIIECGFLTNPDEAKKLCDEKYQKKVAQAVFDGVMEYLKQ